MDGSISGTVTDASATPIAGASVWVIPEGSWTWIGPVTTAADGAYLMAGLTPGCYDAYASAAGHPGQYYDGTYDYYAATLVCVSAGSDTPGVDFALATAGSISGTVTDAGGTPIAGAWMYANSDGWCCGYDSATTAADGTYLIDSLVPGNYRVEVSASGYAGEYYDGTYDYDAATPVSATSGATTTGIDFALSVGGKISGTIADELGTPIAGAYVSADSDSCCIGGGTTAGADGTYLIDSLVPGSYRVHASATGYAGEYYDGTYDYDAATPVSATSGATTSGIDFALAAGGKISGTVTNAGGTPIAGAQVYASANTCCGGNSATTGPDGAYLIDSLVPGNYRVEASASGYVGEYYDGTYDYDAATLVPATSGFTTTGIDFALPVGGKITGTVTNDLGTPIAGAWVTASEDWGSGWGYAYTAGDGTYTIDTLTTGSYRVQASATGRASQYYDGAYDYASAALVSATSGSTTSGIDFALPVGGRISGTVSAAGTPIASVRVYADRDGGGGASAYSAADGTYLMDHLPSGTYRVHTSAYGFGTQYWDHVPDSASSTLVTVSDGTTAAGIDFDLIPPNPDHSWEPKDITWFPFTDSRNTADATLEDGEPNACGNIGATIWYRLTAPISPPGTSSIAIDTAGSGFDTAIALYIIDPAVPSPPGALLQLACSPNWGHNSQLTFTAEPGTTYYIQVGGQSGATGNLVVNADVDADGDGLRDPVETNAGVYNGMDDAGSDPAVADTDGDACGDGHEVLHWDVDLDPTNPWDFYSVPVPPLFVAPDPTIVFRDDIVGASDAQAVFGYFKRFAKTGSLEYEQDLNLNGIRDGEEYDRSFVSAGVSGPPDGVIGASDAQLAFSQFKKQYNCRP